MDASYGLRAIFILFCFLSLSLTACGQRGPSYGNGSEAGLSEDTHGGAPSNQSVQEQEKIYEEDRAIASFDGNTLLSHLWNDDVAEPDQAQGIYWDGSLKNEDNIGKSGPGYQKIFLPRHRGFTSTDMVEVLRYATGALAQMFPHRSPIQLGDLSQEHGGLIPGHLSHQNGLDVDVKFPPRNDALQSPYDTHGFNEKFVINGTVSSNLDLTRTWTLIQLLISTKKINRIFMDVAIKRKLCEMTQTQRTPDVMEALRHIQPLGNHKDHMHVRIMCPSRSLQCQTQTVVPPGDGCNAL